MLIEKPMCNFQNCRYCFDGNCANASRYENCRLTDLHSEIARLRVELDNAKSDTVREMQERLHVQFHDRAAYTRSYVHDTIDQIAKEMLEGK